MRAQWLHTGRMVWIVYGNVHKNAAIKLVEDCRAQLPICAVARHELQDYRCVSLPEMSNKSNVRLDFPVAEESNENSCLLTYFQMGVEGKDSKMRLMNDIALQYMEEPTFNQLRTIEQLGYVVFARATQVRDVVGA